MYKIEDMKHDFMEVPRQTLLFTISAGLYLPFFLYIFIVFISLAGKECHFFVCDDPMHLKWSLHKFKFICMEICHFKSLTIAFSALHLLRQLVFNSIPDYYYIT